MKSKHVVFTFMVLMLSSCAFFRLATSSKFKPPTFAYVRCDVKNVTSGKADVEFVLSSYNPNEVGLKIDLAPKDTSRIVIPAEIVYGEIVRVAGPAAEKILRGAKTIPVRIDAVISGNPTLYDKKEEGSLIPFTVKVSRTEDIPVPQDQINRAKSRAMDAILKKL